MLKKILIGSGSAFALFLMLIFLFGDDHTVKLIWPTSASNQPFVPLAASQKTNLTEVISKNLAAQIAKENPEGPTGTEEPAITLNTDELVKKTLAEQAKNFNEDDMWPVVDRQKLDIRPDSPEADKEYLKTLKSVFAELSGSYMKPDAIPDQAVFTSMASARQKAFEKLYATPVTASLLEIHLDFLDLIGAQRNVFTLLANFEKDPLKALLAMEFQKKLFAAGEEMEKNLAAYLSAHNLTY